MSDLDSEIWLAQRLLDHRGPDVFDGITNRQERCKRFREAIKNCGLETVVIGSKNDKPMNWREVFESLYGESL